MQIPRNQILIGDCRELLSGFPEGCVDLVFADPPYNLQLRQELLRPDTTRVDAVNDDWDKFGSFAEYDTFTREWLQACRRVLKPHGTLWVIGTYHNIHRVGAILQDLGFWILNEVVWIKTNPMPNFRGVRFTNAHETLLWAALDRSSRYTFHHHAMKSLNEDLQMRSDWSLPLCSGQERLRANGAKVHSTQKPEALLYRALLSSSNPGDLVLDPFFGSGTTGAAAKRLQRDWIGIEKNPVYVQAAQERIDAIPDSNLPQALFASIDPRREKRIPVGRLLEAGLLSAGDVLVFGGKGGETATLCSDGTLLCGDTRGSIHQVARALRGAPCNGWELWSKKDSHTGAWLQIKTLREQLRKTETLSEVPENNTSSPSPDPEHG